jgi:alpha-N-arabinofuranosidase
MANCAQLINCLNSLYLAHENRFVITPVGYVFELYASHQGGQALRTVFSSPNLHYDRDGSPASFWGLRGSASVRDKNLTITAVNPSTSDPRLAEIALRGATVKEASMSFLSNADIHAHNTFDQRVAVVPVTKALSVNGESIVLEFPPASVVALNIQLN